jgi:Flp pilus assembly protein TadG
MIIHPFWQYAGGAGSQPLRAGLPGRRRAATAVEFALLAPAVFLFIIGIIEVGRGFMVIHLLHNSAREGCRAAVVPNATSDGIAAQVDASLKAQGVSGATVSIQVNGAEKEASTAKANDKITVEITIPVEDFTWVPGASVLNGSLAGRYSLRKE